MTCRHEYGDPDCTSGKAPRDLPRVEQRRLIEQWGLTDAATPDNSNFEILEAEEAGGNLVLKVKYPNCSKCAYEGVKILVYLGAGLKTALKWRILDPHFADPKTSRPSNHAPAPAARFPASEEGWRDALDYAARKGA